MANRIIFIIIALALITTGCKDLVNDDSFSLKKESYNGNEIRTNGYYCIYNSRFKVNAITIFYRNGIVHNQFSASSLSIFEEELRNGTYNDQNNNFKQCWGLFSIKVDEIKIENIIGMGGLSSIAYIDYGKILNDTTIHFYKHKESYSNYSEVMDDTLHFKQFTPKPDSINVFIK